MVCTPASGAVFPVGTTTVNLMATDLSGNTATASFTVTVLDRTALNITVPANVIVEAANPYGSLVSFTSSAYDLASGPCAPVCTPPSGSLFPTGTTPVTVTATDASGNTATRSFTVAVVPPIHFTAAGYDSRAVLNWSANPPVTGCRVKRASQSGGPYTDVATGIDGATYTDSPLANGTTYYYVLSVTVGSLPFDLGEIAVLPMTGVEPPEVPAGLVATTGFGQVSLSWQSCPHAQTS